MKKLILMLFLTLPFALTAQETGEIKGTLTEDNSNTPIPFANVIIEQNGVVKCGQATDMDGNFWIKNLSPGKYTVKVRSIGLQPYQNDSLTIVAGRIQVLNIQLKDEAVLMSEYTLINTKSSVFHREASNLSMHRYRTVGSGRIKTNKQKVSAKGIKGKKNKVKDTENTETYKGIVENKFENTAKDNMSTFSIDVDRASYANIRRMINNGSTPNKDAVRLEEMINYFHYDYPQPKDEHPFSINMETATCPWNKDHHLVLIGLQGMEHPQEQIPPSNLVFLVDVSGSMDGANRLPLVKHSLKKLVNQLRPVDKISIVVYAGAAGVVLSPTSGNNKGAIIAALDNLKAGGSTAGGEGINLAYAMAEQNYDPNANNRIILCTDGDFNVGVSSETELENLIVSKRDKGIYITTLGYGMGNYKDNTLEVLADKGNGNYSYIDSEAEAEKVLVKEMGSTLFTIAKDVKIQIEFNASVVKSYRLLGYENRILEDWEFNDDKRDAGEIGSGHTVTAIYEVELTHDSSNQTDNLNDQSSSGNEIMKIKFRYKRPKSNKSILIEKVLDNTHITSFEGASENLRFASAVAAFGMVLRESEFKGTADHKMILEIARKAMNSDVDGYRKEFLDLVEASEKLKPKVN